MKKILAIIASLILILAIAFSVFIKIYLTSERVKAFLIPEAEKSLNRKVNIGDIDISLFKGIEIKNFAIKEADGKTDFLKSKDFILKYKLLPLLSRKVVIDELKIFSPEVRIVRDSKGKYNFESIGENEKTKVVKEEKKIAESTGLPVSLLISRILLKNASFSFKDHKKELPDIKGVTNIDTGITSTGRNELLSKGNIEIRLDEISAKKPAKQIRDISAELKYEVKINLESGIIHISKADIKFQEIPVSLTGYVNNFKTSPEIDIALLLPKTKTADILKSISPLVDTKGIILSGDLTADLKLKGIPANIDSLRTDGIIDLMKVSAAYNNVSAVLDGNLKFKEESLNIHLNGTLGENTAELKGSVTSLFKNQKINLNLYSKNLILDKLIPAAGKKFPAPDQKAKLSHKKSKPKEAAPLNLKLMAGGEVKIDSAIYKGLKMENFNMTYQLKNNRFEIKNMSAIAGKGKFNLKSLIDFSKPGYSYNISSSIDSLHADEIVNSFFPKAKDTVFGILSLNLKLRGAGTLTESMRKNLVGNGDFNIKDGKIKNSNITEKLSGFLSIEELKTIQFKKAKGTVKINNGVARLKSIFSSDVLSMDPSGSIGLDETLNLAFDLKLSPSLTDKAMLNSDIASYIKDDKGWGTIPLKVSGTFADPSYGVDVEKAGKRIIRKQTDKLLEDLFNKNKDKDQSGDKKEKQDSGNPLDDVLKQLF